MNKARLLISGIMLLLLVYISVSVISPLFYTHKNVTVNPYSETLASTEYGTVTKMGPYGNATSPVKVAFIVGVHPWEIYSHEAAVESIKKYDKSLKYCYYIYQVNVTGGVDTDYETGRMNGQILARDYIVPDIGKNNFQLVLDIHSNKGGLDYYDVNWFLNVPTDDKETNRIAQELQTKIPGIVFYDPPDPSSPYYVTIPLIKTGTPAIIYEAYAFDSLETRRNLADKLLLAVDSLNLKYPVAQLA